MKPIWLHEDHVKPFVSPPPQKRAFKVLISHHIGQVVYSLFSFGTADVWPGQSTPRHVHDWEQEMWYCLAGQGEVCIGDEIYPMTPGAVAVAPAGYLHHLQNTSATEHFKCAVIFSPSGPERMLLPEEKSGVDELQAETCRMGMYG